MCIIIAKQKGLAITKEILQNCFNNNPDGTGFCVEVDGKLLINKGYFTFDDFYTAYQPYENEKTLIHFRIKTHGKIDEDNCHPFRVSDNIAFVHNGIISNVKANNDKSDTRVFKDSYITPIINKFGEEALHSPEIQTLIESFIGGSKLAFFIKGQENFLIYNENYGNRSKEGIWFSNLSWQTVPKYEYLPAKIPYKQNKINSFPQTEIKKQEVSELTRANGSFSFGTLIKVKCDINTEKGTIFKNTVGEIDRVYNNGTVDVTFYTEGIIENLYPYALEIIDTIPDYEFMI